ncbi:tetratricopeptide repeat protein [Salmonella enterica subsp. enterica]|nr:tetratricopeptide repeat protein [Salmonella enterica subsp. enterica serovar Poona]
MMDYIHTKPLSPGVEMTLQILKDTSALSDQDKPDQAAMDMFNRALAIDASGNEAEALAEYARLIARFGDSDHPAVQEPVAQAMFNRAKTMDASGNETEALAEYARLVARFEGCNIPEVLEIVEEAKERL